MVVWYVASELYIAISSYYLDDVTRYWIWLLLICYSAALLTGGYYVELWYDGITDYSKLISVTSITAYHNVQTRVMQHEKFSGYVINMVGFEETASYSSQNTFLLTRDSSKPIRLPHELFKPIKSSE